MVAAIEHFAIYLKGTKTFVLRTGCLSLLSLEKLFAKSNATMIRKLNKLMDYQFTLKHVAGQDNGVCDFLSRYLHKRRECHTATQTDDTQMKQETVTCNRVKRSDLQSDDSAELAEYLIPPHLFSDEMDCLDDENNRPGDATQLSMTSVTVTPACVCHSDVHELLITEPQKVCTIAAQPARTITQELDLPNLLDLDQIRTAQSKDVVLKEVIRWITDNERPKDLQKLRLPPELIRYWKQFKLLVMRDGVLYRKWIRHDKDSNEVEIQRLLVIVPESLRTNVLQIHHNSLITSHPGIEETYR
jgi:hypothetical protein